MVRAKFEDRVSDVPLMGGRLDLFFEDREDVLRQKNEFLPHSGLFVSTAGKPKPFSEFEISLTLPDGRTCPNVQARLVQIAEVGPEQGLMLQLLEVTKEFTDTVDAFLTGLAAHEQAAEKGHNREDEAGGNDPLLAEDGGRPKRLTLQQKLREMNPTQRAMFAARADKMSRSVLIRDHEPQVLTFLLKNPRLTRQEVFEISKVNAINAQVVEMICANKQWIQHEDIRFNLVMNPKSPLPVAIRLLKTLNMKHLRELAKNHNIKTQIKQTALRIVVERAQ